MIFHATPIPGAFLIHPELLEDERGAFARTWCPREFAAHGLSPRVAQCSLSLTRRRGTVRGLHYQAAPHEETKLVRCTRGAIYDVMLDLRPGSPTLGRWHAVELTAENRAMAYLPEGVAHGFQTLQDEVEVYYQISQFHAPEAARGVRFDDPAFGIAWPLSVTSVSARDRAWPLVVAPGPARPHAAAERHA